ncbi:MAG: methyltransferase domain-containing protein [Methanoregula sp.]|jgi:SAM-dependent methyltransferase|nr:methyltransferase domain-containing protein [Methanoregula sp.]
MKERQLFCPICGKKVPVLPVSPYRGKHQLFHNAELCQCSVCGLIFMQPMPSAADLENYYKTVWTTSDDVGIVYRIQAGERVRYITRHIDMAPDAEILDVGAGHGLLLEAFHKQGYGNIKFYATDPSPENLERMKLRGILAYPDINSLGNQQFDLITICFVLEHIPDPVLFLTGILNHVKPGGFVFLDLPERDDTFKPLLEPHVMVFTENSLIALAEKLGLSIMHMTGYGQTRERLIANEKRSHFSKLIQNWYTGIISHIYPALFPDCADIFRHTMLYDTYKFDEEGHGRWWIRTLFKKP